MQKKFIILLSFLLILNVLLLADFKINSNFALSETQPETYFVEKQSFIESPHLVNLKEPKKNLEIIKVDN